MNPKSRRQEDRRVREWSNEPKVKAAGGSSRPEWSNEITAMVNLPPSLWQKKINRTIQMCNQLSIKVARGIKLRPLFVSSMPGGAASPSDPAQDRKKKDETQSRTGVG